MNDQVKTASVAINDLQTHPKMPSGIPYIIGNEAAERFSFYGMRTILVIFMTQYLYKQNGQIAFTQAEAMVWYHNFISANYFFPLIGALISDIFWGKYKTILTLSFVYCLGNLILAMYQTPTGLALGLTCIAIGSGGIKPCASAHVGDQFDETNQSLLSKVFSNFYFAINFGAFFSSLFTPLLLQHYGPRVAFGVPGFLMLLATFVFWRGENKFIAIPPVGLKKYKEEVFSAHGISITLNLLMLYFFVAFFWSLYDQTGSSWVLQANKMDKLVDLRWGPFQADFLHFELLSSQIQAINPIMILTLIPLFSYFVYPALEKVIKLTPLKKMGAGFLIAALSFIIIARAEFLIESGEKVSILWQFLAYLIITIAEVLVSITSLEFSYTQAPNSMKSFIMGLYLLSVTFGNLITSGINSFLQNDKGEMILTGSDYYMCFVYMILGATALYTIFTFFYKGQTFIHEKSELQSLRNEGTGRANETGSII